MKMHSFQHVPYEGLDRIGPWLQSRGHTATVTRFYAGDPLPEMEDIDGLIVMGGPMGVYEADQYPWITAEMAFIRRLVDSGKKVLGICLGSQLIAGALGAKVYPHTEKEIGWWPVQFAPYPVQGTPLDVFGPAAVMYHWHGDTFDLPAGATLLASSAACRHQAFALGPNVLALQFHPEISEETIGRWVAESGSIKSPGGFVMSEAEMQRRAVQHLPELAVRLPLFLHRFFTPA